MIRIIILCFSFWLFGGGVFYIETASAWELQDNKIASGLSNQERIDLARQYIQEGGEDNERQAAKLLRVVAISEEEDYLLSSYSMLADLRKKIRGRYPHITDVEYKESDKSIGRVLLHKGDIENGINALIEEAECLSSAAQIQLEIMYKYHVEGYPKEDDRILKFYEKTVLEGLPRSQFFLGHIYLNGWGVPKSEEEAQALLEASEWEERKFQLPVVGGR